MMALPRLLSAILLLVLSGASARADNFVWLGRGGDYRVDWRARATRRLAYPRTTRTGVSSADRWFQVAPGGRALAALSPTAGGLTVWDDGGRELLRARDAAVFGFSADGRRLAVATPSQLLLYDLDGSKPRALVRLRGIDGLRFVDTSIVVRARGKSGHSLVLVDTGPEPHQHVLARARRIDAVAGARRRVVYAVPGAIFSLDIGDDPNIEPTKLALDDPTDVAHLELSPDGARLLVATAKRVYLADALGVAPHAIADADAHSVRFSPDGSAWLWATETRGAVVRGTKSTPLPAGLHAARFRQDEPGLVVTADDGVALLDPDTGERRSVGGISPDDGVNMDGDYLGCAAVVLYSHKRGDEKEHQVPSFSPTSPTAPRP